MLTGGHHPPLTPIAGSFPFRLLTLEPGSGDEQVVCQLHLAALSHSARPERQPLYDAVSHAWGPESPTFQIRLGAWPVFVREGLYRFLKQIRSPTDSTTLWIDALCIDQRNMDERSRQVQIMDKIYSSARRSLVWLGPADAESTLAMEVMQQICDTPSRMDRVSDMEHAAILKWSSRPYWTRTWVVQEFLLARDVLIVCVGTKLGWSALINFTRYVSGRTPAAFQPFLESPAYHLMRQKIASTIARLPLERLLVENQHTQCNDPHDKVYAMLGLSTQHESGQRLIPRYDKTLQRLLSKIIEHCQIPPKQIPRYVRFLTTLLRCSPLGEISSTLSRHGGDKMHHLVSLEVGRIVSLVPDAELSSTTDDGSPSQAREQKFGSLRINDISRRLIALDVLNLERLKSYYGLFQPQGANSRKDGPWEATTKVKAVVILTSNCIQAELLVGLAYGDVMQGDVVHYFLGHEVGMVVREFSVLSGCVVCAPAAEQCIAYDPVTHLACQYWSLQTEALIRDPDRQRHHELVSSKVLQLGVPISSVA